MIFFILLKMSDFQEERSVTYLGFIFYMYNHPYPFTNIQTLYTLKLVFSTSLSIKVKVW